MCMEQTWLLQLKELLGILAQDTSKDFYLKFVLQDMVDLILDYCHIEVIPSGLESTLLKMARKAYQEHLFGTEMESKGAVTSISIGGTSTSFQPVSEEMKKRLQKENIRRLNMYRRFAK